MISISSVIELLIGLLIKLSRQTKNLTDNNSIDKSISDYAYY
jgi:hypothetical protein